jgi:HSP20 family protein
MIPIKTERTNPLVLFDDLRADFEQLFEKPWLTPFRRFRTVEKAPWMPKLDVFQKENELVVKADLPGMKKEDITITLEDGALVLKGERKEEKEVKEENFYRMECTFGSFYRRLPLNFTADPAKVAAKLNDGVLEIRVPVPAVQPPETLAIPVN